MNSTPGTPLKIAILREPGTGGRKLMWAIADRRPALTESSVWRLAYDAGDRSFDITVGMPAAGSVHGAVILVDVTRGVTDMVQRCLWHARRRGVTHLVGHLPTDDPELIPLAEEELREAATACGFTADQLEVTTSIGALRAALHRVPDTSLVPGPSRRPAHVRELKRIVLRRVDNRDRFLNPRLWQEMRDGDAKWDRYDAYWRFTSILHQTALGHFDDIPDLITLVAEPHASWQVQVAATDLLAHTGTADLADVIAHDPRLSGEQMCRVLSYWGLLAVAPLLIETFRRRNWPGDLVFLFPWALQRLVVEEASDALESQWERYVSAEDMDEFCAEATRRYEALTRWFGTDAVLVVHAEPFSVRRLGELLLQRWRRGGFTGNLCEWFTAQTGITVSTAEQLELLLRDGLAAFHDGERYFLGHEIADFSRRAVARTDDDRPC